MPLSRECANVKKNMFGIRYSALPPRPRSVTRTKPSASDSRIAGETEERCIPCSTKSSVVTGRRPLSLPPWWASSISRREITMWAERDKALYAGDSNISIRRAENWPLMRLRLFTGFTPGPPRFEASAGLRHTLGGRCAIDEVVVARVDHPRRLTARLRRWSGRQAPVVRRDGHGAVGRDRSRPRSRRGITPTPERTPAPQFLRLRSNPNRRSLPRSELARCFLGSYFLK